MTAEAVRKNLQFALTSALLDTWTVYAEPPDTVNAPAVVVAPGEPYRTTTAYRFEDLALRAVVLIQAAAIGALDTLDAAIELVLVALLKQSDVAIRQVGSVGLVQEVGGVPYLSASIDLMVSIERTRN